MALQHLGTQLLKQQPVLWVQDKKNGNVGGGFMTTQDTYTTRDINYVARNTISGAGIKPNDTTLVTTKGYQSGDIGKASIINSPSTGTDNQLSKIVLPVGEYFFTLTQNFTFNSITTTRVYNVTDAVEEMTTVMTGDNNLNSNHEDGYISVTGSTKEFRIDVSHNQAQDFVNAKGENGFGSGQEVVLCDIKIYKLD